MLECECEHFDPVYSAYLQTEKFNTYFSAKIDYQMIVNILINNNIYYIIIVADTIKKYFAGWYFLSYKVWHSSKWINKTFILL